MARDISAYRQVIVESFNAPATTATSNGAVRVRPIPGQPFSTTLLVACSERLKDTRRYPLGTKFLLMAKMTDRLGGIPFLYAYHGDQEIVVTDQEARIFVSEFKRGRI
jgi:hypothetical protein